MAIAWEAAAHLETEKEQTALAMRPSRTAMVLVDDERGLKEDPVQFLCPSFR
jgi:hypothetical protein